MCGIAGVLGGVPTPERRAAVSRMVRAMGRRGPDGTGFFAAAPVALGMARLAIVDPAGGYQPFVDDENELALVANGEIYNDDELRQWLRGRGHRFRSGSDCETLLGLYRELGLGMLQRVRGMFAFALWDGRARRLVLGRDRMGEKPLYIARRRDGIVFASEMKALLDSGLVDFEIDPVAVPLFFHHHYVPEPLTPLRNVSKLPRAHMLVVDLAGGGGRTERLIEYWRMEEVPPLDDADPVAIVRDRIIDSVAAVCRGQERVGVLLSGGIDSSAVATLARHAACNADTTLKSFTVSFPGDARIDEGPQARATADLLGLEHHEVRVSKRDVLDGFEELVRLIDDPIADPASPGYLALYRSAQADGLRVLLHGQGADELFWGYEWSRRAALEASAKRARLDGQRVFPPPPAPLPRALTPKEVARWVLDGCGTRSAAGMRDRIADPDPLRVPFYDVRPEWTAAARFLHRALPSDIAVDPGNIWTLRTPDWEPETTITRLLCDSYLLENGLAQADRLSMAASVELRGPFVDHLFVEAAIGLRRASPDRGLGHKVRLRAALADLVPAEVLNRPKRGFTPPVREWTAGLLQRYGDRLADGYLAQQGLLRRDALARLRRFNPLIPGAHLISYDALVLETWCSSFAAMAATARQGRLAIVDTAAELQ